MGVDYIDGLNIIDTPQGIMGVFFFKKNMGVNFNLIFLLGDNIFRVQKF